MEHCLVVASEMLLLGKQAKSKSEAREMAANAISSGEGLVYLRKLIEAQGGDVSYVDHPEKLPVAPIRAIVEAPRSEMWRKCMPGQSARPRLCWAPDA